MIPPGGRLECGVGQRPSGDAPGGGRSLSPQDRGEPHRRCRSGDHRGDHGSRERVDRDQRLAAETSEDQPAAEQRKPDVVASHDEPESRGDERQAPVMFAQCPSLLCRACPSSPTSTTRTPQRKRRPPLRKHPTSAKSPIAGPNGGCSLRDSLIAGRNWTQGKKRRSQPITSVASRDGREVGGFVWGSFLWRSGKGL